MRMRLARARGSHKGVWSHFGDVEVKGWSGVGW